MNSAKSILKRSNIVSLKIPGQLNGLIGTTLTNVNQKHLLSAMAGSGNQ